MNNGNFIKRYNDECNSLRDKELHSSLAIFYMYIEKLLTRYKSPLKHPL
jgi:hypothetical protein